MRVEFGNLRLEDHNPRDFSNEIFHEIFELTQDLWADGSHELIHCDSCGVISGKNEVFSSTEKHIYNSKVASLLKNFTLRCPLCQSKNVQLVHKAGDVIRVIHDRLINSITAHTVSCRNSIGELVGYAEAYVDTFDNAFRYELQPHYPKLLANQIRIRIESVLGVKSPIIIVFSVFGILGLYKSPLLFARLLKHFFQTLPSTFPDVPSLMEIGRNNGIYKVFMNLGGISLNDIDPVFFRDNLLASPNYDSVIAVFPPGIKKFKDAFVQDRVRNILQRT